MYLSAKIYRDEEAAPMTKRNRQEVALNLWVVLARSYAAVAAHTAAHAASRGLTGTEFGILEALYHKGDMLLGELQEKVLVSSGGITYLVDRLTEKGLVERRECAEDRRARYAALTRKGTALLDQIFPEHAAMLERVLGGLTGEEQEKAARLLKALGRYAGELPPRDAGAA